MPRASTSTAESFSFAPADPSAASPAAPRAQSKPSRKGKERALDVEDVTRGDGAEGDTYQPRAGQVKRRKKLRSKDKDGRRKDKEGKLQHASEVEDGQETRRKKEKKRKGGLKKPRTARGPDEGTTALRTTDQSTRGQQRKKKRVRIAAPAIDASSDDGDEADLAAGGASSGDDYSTNAFPSLHHSSTSRPSVTSPGASASSAQQQEADIDLADPLNLPLNPSRYTKRYWRSLEYGAYRSALHDCARDRAELGRVLVEWDGIRRKLEEEEQVRARQEAPAEEELLEQVEGDEQPGQAADEQERIIDSSDDGDNYQPSATFADEGANGKKKKRKKPAAPKAQSKRESNRRLRSHDPSRLLLPFPLSHSVRSSSDRTPVSTATSTPAATPAPSTTAPSSSRAASPAPASTAGGELEVDPEDGAQILPLPSAIALAKMAKWPMHSSVLQQREGKGGVPELEEVLQEAAEYQIEKAAMRRETEGAGPRREKRKRQKARSAYGADGPFAGWESPVSGSSSASSDGLESDLDLDEALPSLAHIPPLLSSITTRLLDFIPKSPFPAYDYWSSFGREEGMRAMDQKRGIVRDEGKVGWEEVVEVARERGVQEHVLEKLQAQLVEVFGPSNRKPVKLPPPCGHPYFHPAFEKPKSRKRKSETRPSNEAEDDGAADGGADEGKEPSQTERKKRKRKRTRSDETVGAGYQANKNERAAAEEERLDGVEEDERLRKKRRANGAEGGGKKGKGKRRKRIASGARVDSGDEDVAMEEGHSGFPSFASSSTSSANAFFPLPLPSYSNALQPAYPPPPPGMALSFDPSTFTALANAAGEEGTGGDERIRLPTPPAELLAMHGSVEHGVVAVEGAT